ncbi:MAG: sulfatase-like hydrolase/transferase [Candidatus Hydrogenedentota bacterium]
MKKVIFIAVKLVFITGLFTLLFRPETFGFAADKFQDISISKMREILADLNLGTALFWFSFAAIVKICGIFSGVLRWHFLLKGQGISLPFWYLTKCWFTGRAIGLLLPGTVGLDGYRLVESSVYTGEAIKCTTVIAVEKLIGIVALGLLVFLTLPLGARLFDFNLVALGIVLFILFTFISVAFLMLLNPRIVQVLVAVVPVPDAIRAKVNKLGTAVTAYNNHRMTLLFAVLLGLGVHLGICLMYFGVAMALAGGQASFLDVMFASPLVIVMSVITPTVSGLGVREGVFTALLGGTYTADGAFLIGHLGLWVGEAIPFVLSIPLMLLAGRPDKEGFLGELKKVREEATAAGQAEGDLHLAPEEIADYRNKLIDCIGVGLLGGLIGGAILGLAESIWHITTLANFSEASALWWAPLVYGLVLTGAGLGVAAVLVFGYLLFNKFVPAAVTFGLCLGGTIGAVALVFGRFRYKRDILDEHALSLMDNLIVLGGAVLLAGLAVFIGSILAGWVKDSRGKGLGLSIACYVVLVGIGFALSIVFKPAASVIAFTPKAEATGPNVFLIVVDTLRADYLTAFNASATPKTPNVSALAEDGIVFQKAFAQSSWTKASFGTIFSGLYPEAHTATGKASALPDEVTTIAEILQEGGYYTQGYSNNPNITSIFNYSQGFVDYTDLKPDLLFGAKGSSEKLVLYDILRKVVQKVNGRLGGRINITDFYQPANAVTDIGLDWIDGENRPADNPFMLFLHYMDPHDPFRDPDKPGRGYARVQLGANPDPEKFLEVFKRSYSYEIGYMDEHLGRFIAGLKERGLYEDALIIFTADHGEEFHEHGGWWHGLSLYDEQIAIPLIVKLPNSEVTDVNTDLARSVDIAPTIATLTGLELPEQWQGKALISGGLDLENAETPYSHAHLNFEGIELRAMRTQTKKYIEANEGNKRDYDPVQLYDLEADPGELVNIAGDSEAEVALFQQSLTDMNEFILENAAEPMTLNMENMSQEELDQLESLGYLGSNDEDLEELNL